MPDEVASAPFLVIGESVVDIVQRPGGEAASHAGGSPANVAFGLGRLGVPTVLLTALGDDPHGDLIRRHLQGSGVQVLASGVGQATGTAVATLDATGAATYDFDISWSLPAVPAVPPALHAHTGSIAAAMEPGAAVVADLLQTLRRTGTVSLDPNVRPALLPDRAAVRRRIEDLVAGSDVVKASDEDLAWLYPGEDPAVIRRWLDKGPSVVVVTRGDAGAVGVCSAGRVDVAPERVQVVDTVGAGDSFMAALLHGLFEAGLLGVANRPDLAAISTETLAAVMTTATRAAAITVSRAGAMLPTLAELDEALAPVAVD